MARVVVCGGGGHGFDGVGANDALRVAGQSGFGTALRRLEFGGAHDPGGGGRLRKQRRRGGDQRHLRDGHALDAGLFRLLPRRRHQRRAGRQRERARGDDHRRRRGGGLRFAALRLSGAGRDAFRLHAEQRIFAGVGLDDVRPERRRGADSRERHAHQLRRRGLRGGLLRRRRGLPFGRNRRGLHGGRQPGGRPLGRRRFHVLRRRSARILRGRQFGLLQRRRRRRAVHGRGDPLRNRGKFGGRRRRRRRPLVRRRRRGPLRRPRQLGRRPDRIRRRRRRELLFRRQRDELRHLRQRGGVAGRRRQGHLRRPIRRLFHFRQRSRRRRRRVLQLLRDEPQQRRLPQPEPERTQFRDQRQRQSLRAHLHDAAAGGRNRQFHQRAAACGRAERTPAGGLALRGRGRRRLCGGDRGGSRRRRADRGRGGRRRLRRMARGRRDRDARGGDRRGLHPDGRRRSPGVLCGRRGLRGRP